MNRLQKKIAAHLETGRISNLPTVWGNVLLTYTLCAQTLYLVHFLLFGLAGSLLYVGGCYLGDARDVKFDAQHKPTRPIPSGVLKESSIWFGGTLMVLAGLILFYYLSSQLQNFFLGPGLLVASITTYALFHKKSAWLGLPLIGACRFLLITSVGLVATNAPQAQLFIVAGAVGIYTICFASVARLESSDKQISAPTFLKLVMLLLPLVCLCDWETYSAQWQTHLIFFLPYLAWISYAFLQINSNKGAYVSKCLAGFALLDATFLAPYSLLNATLCLVLFGLALLLQKYTPAT